ncbi:hypothetical protein EP56_05740 [Listeriaceae bacterium FSL A5-0209]|nr:hypothetical protein EP56_05740 [Listeriaceae bacterium FSL A5-0209]
MDNNNILVLVKARLGITTTVRDTYLSAIVSSIIKELTDEKGIVLEDDNPNHQMFIVDYATWRYENRGADRVPRHLQYRLHNLIIHNRGVKNE